jgi:two-component system, sensor histidine kinase and response regulator
MKLYRPQTRFSVTMMILAVFIITCAFEFAKALLFSTLTGWASYLLTALFFSALAACGAWLTLHRESCLRQQLHNEAGERLQSEASQQSLAERTRALEKMTQELEVQIAERKQVEETLRENAERLHLAIQIAQIGTWDWDATTGQVSSGGVPLFPLFGQALQTYEGFFERIHPDDREQVGQAIAFSVVEDKPYNVEFRVVHPVDGTICWISAGGQMYRDKNGKPVRMIGVAQDITKRKQAEERLAQERALLRTLIDNLPDYVYVRDIENRFLIGNLALAQSMGASSPEELVGKTDFDYFPHEIAAEFHADDMVVMRTGQPLVNKEEATNEPQEKGQWILTTKVPLRDPQGEIVGLVGIGRDITERKRMESALLESRGRLDDILSSMQDVIWSYSAETFETLYMGQAAEKVFGRPLYEFFENPGLWGECVVSEDRVTPGDYKQRLLERGSIDAEYRILRPDGEVRWLHERGQVIRNVEGKIVRLDGIASDITERKRAEERLAEERNLLRTLIDSLPHYVYIKDTEGRFVLDNIADARAMGASSPEEVIGKTDFDFYPREQADQYLSDDMQVIRSGQPLLNIEEVVSNKNGEQEWILTSKWPLHDSHGQIIGLFGIGIDLTERKRAEQQTIQLGTERARIKLLADFVRDVSHDFRTPLSTINTSLYLLQKLTDPQRQKQRIDLIQQQTSRLARLIDGLLTLTRLDSQPDFEFQPFDLNRLVREIEARMKPLADEKQITINAHSLDTSLVLQGDNVSLGDALIKVMENAIQYTPEQGAISICTCQEGDCVMVEVKDNGIGIDDNDLPHIFERFYRADKARSAETGGAGLGLAITQKIVEGHEGRIDVESVLGEGSTFRMVLPVDPRQVAAKNPATPPAIAGKPDASEQPGDSFW